MKTLCLALAENIQVSTLFFCSPLSAQSSKTSSFSQDIENNQELIDCGPAGMHRKSIEAAEHLKSGGEDSGNDHNGSGSSPHHNHHQGGPTSSESGQESQDGMGPSSSSGNNFFQFLTFCAIYGDTDSGRTTIRKIAGTQFQVPNSLLVEGKTGI